MKKILIGSLVALSLAIASSAFADENAMTEIKKEEVQTLQSGERKVADNEKATESRRPFHFSGMLENRH